MKIIFTCDTKIKRYSPEFYDMLVRVIANEGYKVSLGLDYSKGDCVTSVCAEGDVDACVYFASLARKYKQQTMLIVNDSNVNEYDLKSQTLKFLGTWAEGFKTAGARLFFNGITYQVVSALPSGVKWN